MGIILSLIIGCLAGFCAGKLMKGGGFGLIMNLVLGLFGGVLGGWLFSLLGIEWGGLLGHGCSRCWASNGVASSASSVQPSSVLSSSSG